MYVYERVHEKTYVYVVSSGFKLSQWCENNGQETNCFNAMKTLPSRLATAQLKGPSRLD